MLLRVAALLVGSVAPLAAQRLEWPAGGLPVCTAAGWQRSPRIVTDGEGGVLVAWEDIRTGTTPAIYMARVTADGRLPWTPDGVRVADAAPGQTLGGIVSDGRGGAYLTYWHRRGGTNDIYAQRIDSSGAVHWAAGGVPVCTAGGDQQWAVIAEDGDGGCLIAWQDRRAGNADIRAQRMTMEGNGMWTPDGALVTDAIGDQVYPEIASTGDGGAFIVWMDRRDGDDVYMQYMRSTGQRGWREDLPVAVYEGRQIGPKIVQRRSGQAAVVWLDERSGNNVTAVFIQLVDTTGEMSYLDGHQLATAPAPQTGLLLYSDGNGGAMAAWTDFRNGMTDGDVYFGHILADGSIPPTSSPAGQPICTLANATQELPALVPDGVGGTLAFWQDKRSGTSYDLYTTRIAANGFPSPGWPANGLLVSDAENNQIVPQALASGTGRAIVVWQDGRVADGQSDIYAQRIAWAPAMASARTLDMGTQRIGGTAVDSIVIRNAGAVPLVVTNVRRAPIGSAPGDFAVYAPTLPLTVPPDSFFTVTVRFTPSGMGERSSLLRINSNAPRDPYDIALRGFGSDAQVSLPALVEFRPTMVGRSTDTLVTDAVVNTGTETLRVLALTVQGLHGAEYALVDAPELPLDIPAGAGIDLQLRFSPLESGTRTAELRLLSEGTDSVRMIPLRGLAGYPSVRVLPVAINFDPLQPGRTLSRQMTISNPSAVPLALRRLTMTGADEQQFRLGSYIPGSIAPGASMRVNVVFAPLSYGSFRATVRVETDDPSGDVLMQVSGVATDVTAVTRPPHPSQPCVESWPQPYAPGSGAPLQLRLNGGIRGRVRVDLVDPLGRVVFSRIDDAEGQDSRMIRIPASLLLRNSAGVYVARVIPVDGGAPPMHTRVLILR